MKVFRKNQVERILFRFNKYRLCEKDNSEKEEEEPQRVPPTYEKKRFPSAIFLKYYIRRAFPFYFNMRYLNIFSLPKPNEIFKYSFERYCLPKTILFMEESKFEELFELADKSEYIAASMLEIDISEINPTDNFKEHYPFTGPYAKAQKILAKKDFYFEGQPDYYIEELNKCFSKIQKFCEVYETLYALTDFIEDMKLFNSRLHNNPQKVTFKSIFTHNNYDTNEKMEAELRILIDNYKVILEGLKDSPLWKEKFENDVSKVVAYANIKSRLPQVYEYINQQKVFK